MAVNGSTTWVQLMTQLDKATLDAVRGTKKEIAAQESHKRQLRRNTARKRAQLQVAREKTSLHKSEVEAREAAKARGNISTIQAREQARAARIEAAQSNQGGGFSAPSLSSNHNILVVALFTIVGLALFYRIVTHPSVTGDWLTRLSDTLHNVSSDKPMFQVVDTTKTSTDTIPTPSVPIVIPGVPFPIN